MRKLLIIALLLFLTGCGQPGIPSADPMPETVPVTIEQTQPPTAPPTQPPADPIAELVDSMRIEEKVGQLFLCRYDRVNAADHIGQYHLGGWILFGRDFENQTVGYIAAEINGLQSASAIPLLMAVDEEGGTVTRVSRYPAFRDSKFPAPRKIYERDGLLGLMKTEAEKCRLLTSIGLNVNVGPVCDITTDKNAFM